MKHPINTETEAGLRLDYIMAAAWFWFRAEDAEENLVSYLNRSRARNLAQRFEVLRLTLPTPQEVYSYAQERWPEYKLHPLT